MIALSDTEIRSWNDRINEYMTLGYRFGVIPRYTSSSTYPAIGITTHSISQWDDWSRKSEVKDGKQFIAPYIYTFSIIEDKDIEFQNALKKLRSYEIGNKSMIDDKEVDFKPQEPTEVRDLHTVNNKKYVRYKYSIKSFVGNIITQFWLIDTALKFATRESKFKVNDIVSLQSDRSGDYLLTEQIVGTSNFLAVKVKEITENTILYEPMIIELPEEQLTWSRTNRIDDIISDGS